MPDARPGFEAALAALARFYVGSETLDESIRRVTGLSMQAMPQTDHAGITLLVDGKFKTSGFTHEDVLEIDQAQYGTGDGPCVEAYRTKQPFIIESTRERGRWQAFRNAAADHGVLSTLSLPLFTQDESIGALNLYAESVRAYDDADREIGGRFASQAAFVLANAQAYWDARTLSENLEQAMASRATIEQAKGIIMGSMGCGPEEAIRVLITQSQQQNIKLRDLAEELVRTTSKRHH
jgi:GAF domain-containing protein